jgi:hypothetical protein
MISRLYVLGRSIDLEMLQIRPRIHGRFYTRAPLFSKQLGDLALESESTSTEIVELE